MEHNRENGNRGGHPGGGSYNDSGRYNPEQGFEGMNYEQRREPYFNKRQQQNSHPATDDVSGSSEHKQDDRSPK